MRYDDLGSGTCRLRRRAVCRVRHFPRIRYSMPDFQPDRLAASLPPLAAASPEPPQSRDYRSFYGLDSAHPGVRTRLGSFRAGPYRLAAQVWLPESPIGTLLMLH